MGLGYMTCNEKKNCLASFESIYLINYTEITKPAFNTLFISFAWKYSAITKTKPNDWNKKDKQNGNKFKV